jgi:hypothetical protein
MLLTRTRSDHEVLGYAHNPLGLLVSFLVWPASACQGDRDDEKSVSASASPASRVIPQMVPPLALEAPPDDASKTTSGLAYKKLTSREAGALPQCNDTVFVHYNGWRQRTGETLFTTKGGSQVLTLDVEHAAPAFREALQLLHKGEKAVCGCRRANRRRRPYCTRSRWLTLFRFRRSPSVTPLPRVPPADRDAR